MNSAANETKRFYVIAVWISLVLAILLVSGIWFFVNSRPTLLAVQSREAAFAGEYQLAEVCLDKLMQVDAAAGYEAALTVVEIADYHHDWETASEVLEQYLTDEKMALDVLAKVEELRRKCTYHQALALYEQGAYAKAFSAAAAIRDYEPAQMLYQLSYQAFMATQVTPAPVSEAAPSPSPAPSNAFGKEKRQDPKVHLSPSPTVEPGTQPERGILDEGRVAVGYHHSVFLRDDGTVLAYGDNSCGQTEVSKWRDVVAVAAGAYHTIGLTKDGRVLATGDNTYGQTDLSLYTNVKQIAAGAWNTCLLLENGQVMSVGFQLHEFAMELIPAQRIAAGSYGLLVRSQGKNTASHQGLMIDDSCERFSVSRGYALGIDAQGRVHSSMEQIPAWEKIARVSAGENAALALGEEGQVYCYPFDRHLKCTFDFGQPVLALCAGPNQYAYVLEDGSIEIRYADGTVRIPEDKLW